MKTKVKEKASLFRPALIVGILALAVRGIVTLDYSRTIFWSSVWMDSATYNDWAKSIVATGDWIGTQPFFMTPFYPYFLAVLYSLFGTDLFVVRFAQMLLGSGTAVLVYLIAGKMFSHRAAMIAGILAALYGPLVFFVNLLLVETVKVFFVTLALYFALTAKQTGDWKQYGYCGLSIGAAILCRPTDALMLIPLLLSFLLITSQNRTKEIKNSAFFLLGVFLLVAPVTARNYLLSGEFIPVTSNGGLNFYLGNNEKAVGVFYNPEQFNMVYDPNGSGYLEHLYGKKYSHSETSSYWMDKALNFIASDPVGFITLMGRKLVLFFHYKEIGQLGYGYDFMAHYVSDVLDYLPVFIIIIPFAVLGIAVSIRQWRTHLLLFGFLAMQILGVVLFFVTDRYRLSAIPFFLVFAGRGAERLWLEIKNKNSRTVILGVAGMAATVLFSTVFNYRLAQDFSTEYYNIGLTYFDSKRYSEAISAYQTSLSIRESHAVYNSLGNVYAAVGNYPLAQKEYWRAFTMNPNEAVSVFSIGTLFVRQQQWDSALVYYDKALAINPRFAPARLNKGLTLYYLQQFAAAIPELEAYVDLEQDKTKTASVVRDIQNLKQLIQEEKLKEKK